jgi:cell division septum initiation protein DivIVA
MVAGRHSHLTGEAWKDVEVTQDHASPLGDSSIDSLFETTMRGYNKRQVDEYIGWMRAELSSAQDDARTAREKADEQSRDLQRANEDLVAARSESSMANRPQHEEVSERLAQILRLADEEADQKRARASEEAGSTLDAAREQSAKVLEAARSAAEGIISAARERAEKEAAAAKAEAEALLANAASSSQATIEDAEVRAGSVLADADRRTSQITALQDDRLAALREVHTDTLRRLEVVRGALEKVLTAEIDAGPPDGGISPAPLPAAGMGIRAADVDRSPLAPVAAPPVAVPTPVAAEDEDEVDDAVTPQTPLGVLTEEDAAVETDDEDVAAEEPAASDDEASVATGMLSRAAIAEAAMAQGMEPGLVEDGADVRR